MHRSLDEFEIQSDPTMCFTTRPRYQVSVYRTIGPLVKKLFFFTFCQILQASNWLFSSPEPKAQR